MNYISKFKAILEIRIFKFNNLTEQSSFDKTTRVLINNFLGKLPTPICLVEHNGKQYDFPLLKTEMEKADIQLSSDILCADSYIGTKENCVCKLHRESFYCASREMCVVLKYKCI